MIVHLLANTVCEQISEAAMQQSRSINWFLQQTDLNGNHLEQRNFWQKYRK